jgi:hypothetical protein
LERLEKIEKEKESRFRTEAQRDRAVARNLRAFLKQEGIQ